LVFPEHTIVETHPPDMADLRIQNPWPELQQYVESVDLEFKGQNLNAEDLLHAHSHVPWLVLVFRFAEKYKSEHGGVLCAKEELRKYILEQRLGDGGRKKIEENFDEAAKNIWRAYQKYSIPSSVKEILADAAADVHKDSTPFWFLVHGLKQFVAHEGAGQFLPLPGSIPDMHSATKPFIALSRVYHDRAEKDVAAFAKHVEGALHRTGAAHKFSHEELSRFCKNASGLRVIRCRSYSDSRDATNGETLSERLNDEAQPEGRNVLWFLIMAAAAEFQAKHVRFPGQNDSDVAGDIPLLRAELDAAIKTYGVAPSDEVAATINDHIIEAVRYGGCEMHNIAAFQGGVVSLEVIKLATHQWVPLVNTFIFNGINGTSVSLEI